MDVSIRWASPFSAALLAGLAIAALSVFALLRRAGGRPIAPARRPGLIALRALILVTLAVILANPVRVEETRGSAERPRAFYLLDASESMALGRASTRWDEALATIVEAERARQAESGPRLSVFRFGSQLAAVESPPWLGSEARPPAPGGPGSVLAAETPAPIGPTDPDTLLIGSLEALAGRFGQVPPRAVVVFSDGRARDPDRSEAIARAYARMGIPIHVLPVGDPAVGGDVAVVSLVGPARVRKHSQVDVQVFVRSFGYDGRRAELRLAALDDDGHPGSVLANAPIILRDGLESYTLAFDSGEDDIRIEARVDAQQGEVSADNNAFATDLAIDHTKIRVLYVEGEGERQSVPDSVLNLLGTEVRGAFSPLRDALMKDPDLECIAFIADGLPGDFSSLIRADEPRFVMPQTASELFAFDAIVLSNIPRDALTDEQLGWIETWIARRGGGLCMAGGPNSFASGGWADSTVGRMLPVALHEGEDDWQEAPTRLRALADGPLHPIWHISADDARNRALLGALPTFSGSNRLGRSKPGADLLAAVEPAGGDAVPVIATQSYGRGRTMVMATPITRRWASEFVQSWGEQDARYYEKFWRNVVYWLTENSSIGRRRLLVEADKRLYRPGEPIALRARTYDENASTTLDYRLTATVEPLSAADITSDESPLRRPADDGQGPLLAWGEEFDLTPLPGESAYGVTLPISSTQALPTGTAMAGGLRLELTAYESYTQVDSTAVEIRIVDDPSERQNPLPDHDLLRRLAAHSGGRALRDARDLAEVLDALPVDLGPSEIRRVPTWGRWWTLALLIGLLTADWIWRRRIGLA